MFCTRCGLAVEEGTRFCRSCGQEVGVRPPASPVVTPAPPAPVAANTPQPIAGATPVYIVQPYGGFWVRLVAAMIDGLILGIPFMFIFIFVVFLMGGFALIGRRLSGISGLPPEPGQPPGRDGYYGPSVFWVLSCIDSFPWRRMALFRRHGKFGAAGHLRQGSDVFASHKFGRATAVLRTCFRTVLLEDYHRTDPVWNRLHHGGIHGKKAGPPRHDRRNAGHEAIRETADFAPAPVVAGRKKPTAIAARTPLGFVLHRTTSSLQP